MSDTLWEDLIYRLSIGGLRIYKYGQAQWCDGFGGGCIIHLDKDENVKDIEVDPRKMYHETDKRFH